MTMRMRRVVVLTLCVLAVVACVRASASSASSSPVRVSAGAVGHFAGSEQQHHLSFLPAWWYHLKRAVETHLDDTVCELHLKETSCLNEIYTVRFCHDERQRAELFLDHLANSWTLHVEDARPLTGDFAVDSLPVPSNLVALGTDEGMRLFLSAQYKKRALSMLESLTTQETQTFCAIASSVIILNSLGVPRPTDPIYSPYAYFTQSDFFSPCVEKHAPKDVVHQQGLTIPQLASALQCWPCLELEVVHANETTLQDFVERAKAILNSPDSSNHNSTGMPPSSLLVNYLHSGVGEVGGGHFSPVAAYDEASDRFLVLDVARYKYPAVWVPSSTLFDSMSTLDSTSQLYRGFLVLKRSTLSECAHPSEAHDEGHWSGTNGAQEQERGKKKARKHKPVRITISDSALVASMEEEAMCPSGPL